MSLTLSAVAEKWSFERELMATRFTIVCYSDDPAAAQAAAESAFAIAEKVNAVASDYLPNSELKQLASKPIDTPVSLSPLFYDLLDHSRNMAESTQGAFDPTLGSLTKLWRETRHRKSLPDPEKLEAARAAVGWKHFTLHPKNHSITIRQKNMEFDLGGIAKGYAADLMLESLIAAGLPQSMVTAGGDIRLGNPPPGRDGWNVAVQTFELNKRDEILVLSNAAVSTSGDLHQSVEIDGVKYSHILDPRTGLGLTRRIAATVIADTGKLSDPIATAACVLGEDGSEALKKIPGVRGIKMRTLQESPATPRFEKPTNGTQDEK
ncbi:MAG: FAD:protein FMN transferase [Verrucomicrobiota bacterium]